MNSIYLVSMSYVSTESFRPVLIWHSLYADAKFLLSLSPGSTSAKLMFLSIGLLADPISLGFFYELLIF